jgi:hypothetical protein
MVVSAVHARWSRSLFGIRVFLFLSAPVAAQAGTHIAILLPEPDQSARFAAACSGAQNRKHWPLCRY